MQILGHLCNHKLKFVFRPRIYEYIWKLLDLIFNSIFNFCSKKKHKQGP